jgi:hypothetical protein
MVGSKGSLNTGKAVNYLRGTLYSDGDGFVFTYDRLSHRKLYLEGWQVQDRFAYDREFGRKTRIRVQARVYGGVYARRA